MKKDICLLLLIVFTLACNDDDVSSNNEPTLKGQWSLTNVTGGFAGIDDAYEKDVIIWGFNPNDQELTVTNTNIELIIYDGFPTGVYDYQVVNLTGDAVTLMIDDFNFSLSALTDSSFVLQKGAFVEDGFQLTFMR